MSLKGRCLKNWFWRILISSFLLQNSYIAHCKELHFSASGYAKKTVYDQNNQIQIEFDRQFSVSVNGDAWQIISRDSAEREERVYSYTNAALHFFGHLVGETDTFTNSVVRVHTREIPSDSSSLAHIIWLAYCSSTFFENRNGIATFPRLWRIDGDAGVNQPYNERRATWELNKCSLPISLNFSAITTGNHLSDDLETEFVVQKSKTLDGLEIPSEWSFTRYFPPDAKPGTRRIRSIIGGTIISLNPLTRDKAIDLPAVPTNTTVTDYRMPSALNGSNSGVRYSAKSSEWPISPDTNALRRYQAIQGRKKTADLQRASNMSRARILFCGGVVLVSLVSLMTWSYISKNK